MLDVGRWTLDVVDFVGLWTLDVGRWTVGPLDRWTLGHWDVGTLDVGCWLCRWLLVIAEMPSVQHNLFYPYVGYHIRLPGRILPESTSFKRSTQLGKIVPYD